MQVSEYFKFAPEPEELDEFFELWFGKGDNKSDLKLAVRELLDRYKTIIYEMSIKIAKIKADKTKYWYTITDNDTSGHKSNWTSYTNEFVKYK